MNGLTTHVLDTMRGIPARGIKIELWSLDPSKLLKSMQTNADGRVDAPLLVGDESAAGSYALVHNPRQNQETQDECQGNDICIGA